MNIILLNDSFPPVIDGVANVVMNYLQGEANEHYVSCDYIKVGANNAKEISEKIKRGGVDGDG